MIKTNVLFAQEFTSGWQLQTHIESYQVKGNVLTYRAETNVCTFLSLPQKSFQEFFLEILVDWTIFFCRIKGIMRCVARAPGRSDQNISLTKIVFTDYLEEISNRNRPR